MGRDAVQCGRDVPTFRSNLLPLSSGQTFHLTTNALDYSLQNVVKLPSRNEVSRPTRQ